MTAPIVLPRMLLIWTLITFPFSLSREHGRYSVHEEQLGVLRLQGVEGYPNSLRNPHMEWSSGSFPSEIVARRDIGGWGELAGGRLRRGQLAAQRRQLYWHIYGCQRQGVPPHPAREHRQEPQRV
jgi:hypothetical protein